MVAAGYALVLFNIKKQGDIKQPKTLCIIKTVTGIPCPTCGTTRSVSLIAQGKLKPAIIANPLGFLACIVLLISPLIIVFDFITKNDYFFNFYKKTESIIKKKWIAISAIMLILANWIWNIFKEL
jgi:hypothetical protein